MTSNRFTNLRRAKPEGQKEQPTVAAKTELSSNSDLASPEMPKRGRPRAKRSSGDFAQATAYVRKETYTAVKHLLLDQKKEYSVLVQELLDDWLQKQM